MVSRDFKTNQLDYYIQDTWRALPQLSVTFGVRQMFIQTPYEVNGQQVSPTFSMHDWAWTRASQAALGNCVQPTITFAPSGKANGGKPFWPMAKLNIGPHIGLAYSAASLIDSAEQRVARISLWSRLVSGLHRGVQQIDHAIDRTSAKQFICK
jgi:hypothetical protein